MHVTDVSATLKSEAFVITVPFQFLLTFFYDWTNWTKITIFLLMMLEKPGVISRLACDSPIACTFVGICLIVSTFPVT